MATSIETLEAPSRSGGFVFAPRVPRGLAAAVEGLTREVLRHQPEDIHVFAAHHFERLLKLREQYGLGHSVQPPGLEYSRHVLRREVRQDSRKSNFYRGSTSKRSSTKYVEERNAWTLNETVKLLERHRSIFGGSGRKISSEETQASVTEKLHGESSETNDHRKERRHERGGQRSSRSHRSESRRRSRSISKDSEEASDVPRSKVESKDESREQKSSIPKLISQVSSRNTGMLTKDIKYELRRNRLGVKNKVERSQKRLSSDLEASEASGTSKRSSTRRALEKVARIDLDPEVDSRSKKKVIVKPGKSTGSRSRSRKPEVKSQDVVDTSAAVESSSRTLSMDRVKDYVVHTFAASQSLEELQSPKYVEKVQEVIDKTAPIIRAKVDELKNIAYGRSRRSAEDKSKEQSVSDGSVDSSSGKHDRQVKDERSESDSTKQQAGEDEDVEKAGTDQQEMKTNGQVILEDIISTSQGKSQHLRRSSQSNDEQRTSGDAHDTSGSEVVDRLESLRGSNKVSLPAVRPPSAKSSKSTSKNDSDSLVLPPISPEAAKPAKKRDDISLPLLSVAASSVAALNEEPEATVASSISMDTTEDLEQKEDQVNETLRAEKKIEEMPEEKVGEDLSEKTLEESIGEDLLKDEVFKDSLNVTPEVVDLPQRPDSLEPEESFEVMVENEEIKTGGLTDKLIELEMAERSLEKALEIRSTREAQEAVEVERLAEAEEEVVKEEKAEDVETLPVNVEKADTFIKNKLQEVEDTEKRIEEIFDSQISKTLDSENVDAKSATEEAPRASSIEDIKEESVEGEEHEKSESNKTSDLESHRSTSSGELMKEDSDDAVAQELIAASESSDPKATPSPRIPPPEVPYAYILTEGSPCEIPETVTTVIIPDRLVCSPESEILEVEIDTDQTSELPENRGPVPIVTYLGSPDLEESSNQEARDQNFKSPMEAFGEYIKPESTECSTVDIDFIRGIKAGHDIMITRQDLDRIREDEEEDSCQAETARVVDEPKPSTSAVLEDILEKEEKDSLESKTVPIVEESDVSDPASSERTKGAEESSLNPENSSDEVEGVGAPTKILNQMETEDPGENSLDAEDSTEARSTESTNEVKETTVTDRSTESLSLDPGRPIVPELNLDSLQDITLSSFNMTNNEDVDDDAEKEGSNDTRDIGEILPSTSRTESLTSDERMNIEGRSTIVDKQNSVQSEDPEELAGDKCEGESAKLITPVETVQPKSEKEESVNDSEEEIAKELIEIDRSENTRTPSFNQLESQKTEDHGDELPHEDSKEQEIHGHEVEPKDSVDKVDSVEESTKVENAAGSENAENSQRETLSPKTPIKESETVPKESVTKEGSPVKIHESPERNCTDEFLEDSIETRPCTAIKKSPESETHHEEQDPKSPSGSSHKIPDHLESSIESKGEVKNITKDLSDSSEVELSDNRMPDVPKPEETPKDESSAPGEQITTDPALVKIEKEIIPVELPTSSELSNVKKEEQVTGESIDERSSSQEGQPPLQQTGESTDSKRQLNEADDTPLMQSTDDSIVRESVGSSGSSTEKRECHVYVPEVSSHPNDSITETSSTFHSAVTKIQAGVRGFLIRRRLRGDQPRSSTLDSVPSIQDSVMADTSPSESGHAVETPIVEDKYEEHDEKVPVVQANQIRESKARQRLRREDALQKTTLSLENAFATNGLQHTGEFHDCIPLPVLENVDKAKRIFLNALRTQSFESKPSDTVSTTGSADTTSSQDDSSSTNQSQEDTNEKASIAEEQNNEKSNEESPIVQAIPLHMPKPNMAQVVDILMMQLVKDDALQNSYLNFITSVEDMEHHRITPNIGKSSYPGSYQVPKTKVGDELENDSGDFSSGCPSGSIREPLALPGTPLGVVIEDITSLEQGSLGSTDHDILSNRETPKFSGRVSSDLDETPGPSNDHEILSNQGTPKLNGRISSDLKGKVPGSINDHEIQSNHESSKSSGRVSSDLETEVSGLPVTPADKPATHEIQSNHESSNLNDRISSGLETEVSGPPTPIDEPTEKISQDEGHSVVELGEQEASSTQEINIQARTSSSRSPDDDHSEKRLSTLSSIENVPSTIEETSRKSAGSRRSEVLKTDDEDAKSRYEISNDESSKSTEATKEVHQKLEEVSRPDEESSVEVEDASKGLEALTLKPSTLKVEEAFHGQDEEAKTNSKGSLNISQDSQITLERSSSPITTMQMVPAGSVDVSEDHLEKNEEQKVKMEEESECSKVDDESSCDRSKELPEE